MGEECSQAAPDPYLQGTRVCPWGRVLRLPQLSLAASAVDKGSPGACAITRLPAGGTLDADVGFQLEANTLSD